MPSRYDVGKGASAPRESSSRPRESRPPREGGSSGGGGGGYRSRGPGGGGGGGGGGRGGGRFGSRRRKKVCIFCQDNSLVKLNYKSDRMKRYLTDRGKILPQRVAGTCAKHQRWLTVQLKRARTMGLLPYVGSTGERQERYGRSAPGRYDRSRG
ncbi:MAG: 30S ribosomal protein S18 [Candidatus Lindowbacteria bacterium]|nr:30S ribosomal protein S18 [Candidatus Lindowbacteria bacterium]